MSHFRHRLPIIYEPVNGREYARPLPAWVCYNATMRDRNTLMLIATGIVAGLTACVASPSTYNMPPRDESIPFAQLKAAPDSYKGQQVVLGGRVLSARRLKEGTRIEVLQLPLDGSQQAGGEDLTRSQGRFVGMHKEFLDPATLPPGIFIIVTGEVAGAITLPLDETDYTYPVIEIRQLTVRPYAEEIPTVRMRPMPPSWGPYWGPYWRPYPYW